MKQDGLSVIIVAAGKGNRLLKKTGLPKQFYRVGRWPLLYYSARIFDMLEFVKEIILVFPPESSGLIIKKYPGLEFLRRIKKLKAVVTGGEKRQDSVSNALSYISRSLSYIAVHDAARPFVKAFDIEKVFGYAQKYGACVLGAESKNTMKIIDGKGFISYTPQRENIREAYTPQVFRKDILLNAYSRARERKLEATDDSMLVEQTGSKVFFYSGSPDNIKITTEKDLIYLRDLKI